MMMKPIENCIKVYLFDRTKHAKQMTLIRQFRSSVINQVSRKKIVLTSQIQNADSQLDVLDIFLNKRCHFDNVHLSKSFKKLAKLPNETLLMNNPVFKDMCQLTETRIQIMSTRSIEEITYAISKLVNGQGEKLPLVYGSLSTIILDVVNQRMKEFKFMQLACLCFCFQEINNNFLSSAFLNKVSDCLNDQVLDYAKRWPIIQLYSVYGSRQEDYSITDNLEKRLLDLIPRFTTYQIAFILTTIAKFNHFNSSVDYIIEKLIRYVLPLLGNCNLHDLSNLIWSLAKLKYPHEDVIQQHLRYAIDALSSGIVSSKYLAKLAWSFAKLRISDQKVYALISSQIVSNSDNSVQVRQLVNIAWAFATSGYLDLICYNTISKTLLQKAEQMNEQDIVNTVWALASMGYRNNKLLYKFAELFIRRINHIDSRNLSTFTWSYATLQCDVPHLYDIITTEAVKRMKLANSITSKFQPDRLLILVWSLIVAGVYSETLIKIVLHPIFIDRYLEGASKLQKCQLYQINMAAKLNDIEAGGGLTLNHLYSFYQTFVSRPTSTSEFESDVASCLISSSKISDLIMTNIKFYFGHSIDSVMKIRASNQSHNKSNLLYLADNTKYTYIAIEADGPSHFSCNEPYTNLGHSSLKQNFLRRMGFTFVQITYHDWLKLNNKEEKIFHLLQKIEAELKIPIDTRSEPLS